MSKTEFTASANVRITVEVQNLGPYGADWTAEKIHEQTSKEAIEKVLRLLASCQHCGKERSHGRFAIVSVEPGFYGQKFLDLALPKIEQLKKMIGSRDILIEADGGIGEGNIGRLARAGVDIVVAGSSCFAPPDSPSDRARALKSAALNG
jgi:3-keto-L-gulonate-6-phosphate decarboxylase